MEFEVEDVAKTLAKMLLFESFDDQEKGELVGSKMLQPMVGKSALNDAGPAVGVVLFGPVDVAGASCTETFMPVAIAT